MFTIRQIFSIYNAGMVGGRTAPHECAEMTRTSGGERGMVLAGGSASRTINNSDTPDPGGSHHPAWKRPKDDAHGPRWTPDTHGFPVLGSLTSAEKIAAIVRFRMVLQLWWNRIRTWIVLQLWWNRIRTWTRSGAQSVFVSVFSSGRRW